MKNAHIVLIAIAFILLSSCGEDKPTGTYFDRNYIVFGSFYGECIGNNCVKMYKIENGVLSGDHSEFYVWNSFYEGSFFTMPQSEYDLVKKIINYIPPSLLVEPQGNIGSPNSHDQGGLYLELNVNYSRKFWKIDMDTIAIPHYLIPITDTIKTYIQRLQ